MSFVTLCHALLSRVPELCVTVDFVPSRSMLRTLSLRPCTRLPIPNSTRCCNYATYSDAIHAKNKNANALVFVAGDGSSKTKRGSLNDVPTAVKDNICTKFMPTTCSSEMLREFVSPFDATVVELLEKAGAPIVGKANCDEFGMGYVLQAFPLHSFLTLGL